jgi:hypothetical protein
MHICMYMCLYVCTCVCIGPEKGEMEIGPVTNMVPRRIPKAI